MSAPTPLADVMITLGARDLPRLRDFYRKLRWPQLIDDGQFAAFELRGVVLALFPAAELARDGNAEPDRGSSAGIRFTIGIMVDTPQEVGQLTEQMRNAGARVTKEPVDAEFFTGRSAYRCDPEGNYFEITWAEPSNPITLAPRHQNLTATRSKGHPRSPTFRQRSPGDPPPSRWRRAGLTQPRTRRPASDRYRRESG